MKQLVTLLALLFLTPERCGAQFTVCSSTCSSNGDALFGGSTAAADENTIVSAQIGAPNKRANVVLGGVRNLIDQTEGDDNGDLRGTNGILAGDLGRIIGSTGSAITGGFISQIKDGADYSAIIAGSSNTISGQPGTRSAILAGAENNVLSSIRSVVAGGRLNIVESSSNSAVVGGQSNVLNNSVSSFVAGGQRNELDGADYAVALGNFAQVSDAGAIVISARNTDANDESLVDEPEKHCLSQGENTVHICTRDNDGLFVNGLSLQDLILNVTQGIVQPACLTPGDAPGERRRLFSLDDCPKTFSPTNSPTTLPSTSPTTSPTLDFFGTQVGRILFTDRDDPEGEDWSELDAKALEAEGLDKVNRACAVSESKLEQFLSASKVQRFRELFPPCVPTPGLSVGEVAGIATGVVGTFFAGAAFFLYWWFEHKKGKEAQHSKEEILLAQPADGI